MPTLKDLKDAQNYGKEELMSQGKRLGEFASDFRRRFLAYLECDDSDLTFKNPPSDQVVALSPVYLSQDGQWRTWLNLYLSKFRYECEVSFREVDDGIKVRVNVGDEVLLQAGDDESYRDLFDEITWNIDDRLREPIRYLRTIYDDTGVRAALGVVRPTSVDKPKGF